MKIETLVVGPIQTNCYILVDEESGEALCVDPGDEGGRIVSAAHGMSADIRRVVLTHTHWDHVGGVPEVAAEFSCPVCGHEGELSTSGSSGEKSMFEDCALSGGMELKMGSVRIKVLFTPGHTAGGLSLLADGVVFVGDLIFKGSVGRTDLPGGDWETLIGSIKNEIVALPPQTVIYPGHGPSTTVGEELASNPYLR